jgi:hypothetical protein
MRIAILVELFALKRMADRESESLSFPGRKESDLLEADIQT